MKNHKTALTVAIPRLNAVRSRLSVILLTVFLFSSIGLYSSQEVNWPSFRGTNTSGVAEGYSLPVAWNVERSENIQWKTPIPGLGLSSPIIWGNRIFLSTAISGGKNREFKPGLYGNIFSVKDDTHHRWIVYCVDKNTGKILWEKTTHSGVPKVRRHTKSTHANSTLATDGNHVVAFFGSEGLYCYDMDGKLLWSQNFGLLDSGYFLVPSAQWEFGSSPVIYNDMVIIQCDVQKNSFLAAFNIRDGSQIWRTARNDVPGWSTPAIHISGRNAQIVVNGFKHIGGYDAKTGKELWWMKGGGDIPVPTPVFFNDMVFITNAHGTLSPIYAIKLDARGDISLKEKQASNKYIPWSKPREGSYMSTPLIYGDYLYNCRWNGVLCCYDARTGKRIYQKRLGNGTSAFTSSPVASDGNIYLTSEEGDVYIVQAGPEFKVLEKNSLDGVCLTTPAISEGKLFFRTRDHLIAISNNSGTK